MRLDAAIDDLASGQHSLVATWQLTALGLSDTELSRIVHSDRWERVTRRVLALTGGAPSPDRDDMAAVLDAVCPTSRRRVVWSVAS